MKKTEGNALVEINIGISKEDRKISHDILNKILADEFVLLVQTLNFHWNLVGPEFHDYHLLFDDQYRKIFDFTDNIAERVRALDGIALGSMAAFLQQARLNEYVDEIPKPPVMVHKLLAHHESIIRSIRKGIDKTGEDNRDMGTNNFLADLIEKHEKMAWMLRSLIRK